MRSLTHAQKEAIEHSGGRLRILACAGSGKTEVLARRAARLLSQGTDPASIIAFTFTEKAAAELKARIESRAAEADARFRELPPCGRGMFIGTTHGWAFQALQRLGGIYETMDGLTEEQEWVLLHRVARRLGVVDLYAALEGKESSKVAAASAIHVFLRSAEVAQNERIDRTELERRAPEFAAVLDRYEWLLERMRLMPFRLMIARAVDALAPDGSLSAALAGRVSHVLVDEFQDFNRAQDALLGRLSDLGATITAVADDDQAIYQWRGGDVSLFVSFADRYQAATVRLAENHRSRPEIVRFASLAVESLPGRLDKTLESARAASRDGCVEVAVAETAEDEARLITDRIAGLIEAGHRPADIAVLYRSVRTSARTLVEALRERAIPVAVIGKTSLLASPETALVAHILVWWAGGTWYPNGPVAPEIVTTDTLLDEIRHVNAEEERHARRRLDTLERLGERVRREGVADVVRLYDELLVALGLPRSDGDARWQELGLGRMSELLTEFDHMIRRAAPSELYENRTGDRADEADEDTALAAHESEAGAEGEAEDEPPARRNVVLGARRGEVYLIRLRAFLEEFASHAAEETPDRSPDARDAVQIMTVHQAKGLEFPIVFVPSLIEGRFPSAMTGRHQPWYVPDDLFDRDRYEGREDDEARLLYVALTRAKELLVVSWFEKHRKKKATPSRFLTRHLRSAFDHMLRLGTASPAPASARAGEEPLDVDFSSLVTYFECGYRYWLRHICGFQPPIATELGFGKLLHHVVAELARKAAAGEPPTEADVDGILARSFYLPFAGPIPAEKLREAAQRRAKAYVRRFGHELVRVIQPEVRFEVPLGKARVRGRIDLILRAANAGANAVELIDFKTSSNRPPPEIHENQLRMYAAAAERIGLEPVALAIHDLDADAGGRLPVSNDGGERERFAERLEAWVDGIRARRFEAAKDAKRCGACDFRRFCRYAAKEADVAGGSGLPSFS